MDTTQMISNLRVDMKERNVLQHNARMDLRIRECREFHTCAQLANILMRCGIALGLHDMAQAFFCP
jgi:hypothetical protein